MAKIQTYSILEMRTMYGKNGVPLSHPTWQQWIKPISDKLKDDDGRKVRLYTPKMVEMIFELLGHPD